jgi:hypothetical protein
MAASRSRGVRGAGVATNAQFGVLSQYAVDRTSSEFKVRTRERERERGVSHSL